jgi:diguanylate cyclase (GGDEF)-like protein
MRQTDIRRNAFQLRRVISLVLPGAVLLFVAWAIHQEQSVRETAVRYAAFICFGTLAASALLSWYHNYARVLCASVVATLAIWTFGQTDLQPGVMESAMAFLFPLSFAMFAAFKERGFMTLEGVFKAGLIGVQILLVEVAGDSSSATLRSFLQFGENSLSSTWLSWSVVVSFTVVAAFLIVLICLRRTSVEAGLFWALVGLFAAIGHVGDPGTLYLYGSAVGLVLSFAVLEHGFDLAYRDELTGLPGRRAFNEVLQQLRRRYTIAMCDVDNFKSFNDTYGHDAGDQILKTVASMLFGVKGGGRAFRYGGEEFALVFNGRSAADVQPFLESMRDAISQMGLVLNGRPHPDKAEGSDAESVQITVSIGVADSSGNHARPEIVLEAADAALYRAKEAGKNCVRQ